MKIKTEVLQKLVSTAIKGCTFNKIVPITSLLHLEVSNGNVKITTTDSLNVLEVQSKHEDNTLTEDFSVVLEAKQFHDLVSRTTVPEIELQIKQQGEGHFLDFVGNGNYVLEVPIMLQEGQGFTVKMKPVGEFKEINVPLKTLQNSLKLAETALPETMESVELLSYYLHEDIILTSDRFKVTGIQNVTQLHEENINLTVDFVNLLQAVHTDDKEEVLLNIADNMIEVVGKDFVITGQQSLYKNDYPLEPIVTFLEVSIPNKITINKNELEQTLDRLNLFVSVFDKNTIQMSFNEDSITIESKRKTGKETIKAKDVEINDVDKQASVHVDLVMLEQQLEAHTEDFIDIYYGNDDAIKLKSKDVTQIISLLGVE